MKYTVILTTVSGYEFHMGCDSIAEVRQCLANAALVLQPGEALTVRNA